MSGSASGFVTPASGSRHGLHLRLPATSANLGPAFDAAALALSLFLEIEARPAAVFAVHATGRDADLVASLRGNLLLNTYAEVLGAAARAVLPLHLHIVNEIPLGMGCGSSAAALLAGVALASHFGDLGWSDAEIVAEATRREGHPDNVAACWYGGFTVSVQHPVGSGSSGGEPVAPGPAQPPVEALTFAVEERWQFLLAMQRSPLATVTARALLPATFSRADAVFNIGRTSLLVAAFAQRRLDLLRLATADRLHQPFRAEACPLLAACLPLLGAEPTGLEAGDGRAGSGGEIAAVTLSGAGPSVLLTLADGAEVEAVRARVWAQVGPEVEVLALRAAGAATRALLPP